MSSAIERDDLRGIADVLGFGESYVAGEGDQKAEVESAARVVERSGEAMQYAAEAGGSPVFFDERQAVVPGVFAVVGGAAVNDDGQLGGFANSICCRKTFCCTSRGE